jgi:2-dehydro-3-deoxyglucarate aldolase/4-hydroxy-2-oxoheptanedioate aldolase
LSGARPSDFKARLARGETVIGSFVNLGSAVVTEIMGIAGFDWLVLDLEHGAGDEGALLAQLQALAGSGAATLVRVEAIDLPRFMHALDLGADGVLVPRLRTVDDARRCVEYARYAGQRGVARYNRSFHWGQGTRSLAEVDAETICAVQIETRGALEAVDEIAAVEGVDILFVGPVDLAHSLGLDCPADAPELMELVADVASAAAAHGKTAGVLVRSMTQLLRYREAGFRFLGCNSDGGLLIEAASDLAGSLSSLKQPLEAESRV